MESVEVLNIQGRNVWVQGQGPVLLMLHGWPDTARLWAETAEGLQDRYRCVRVTHPGFDIGQREDCLGFNETLAWYRQVIDTVSPHDPVTLMIHDWGCVYGYELAARHPERITRIVAVDIGDHTSRDFAQGLGASARLMILAYQNTLALAWQISRWHHGLGDAITRFMARILGHKDDPALVHAGMCYPYAMQWMNSLGGFGRLARVEQLRQPILYLYGTNKPFMFHSEAWLRALQARPDCHAEGLDCGHWVMRSRPAELLAAVRKWLG